MCDIVCDMMSYCDIVGMFLILFKAKVIVKNNYSNLENYRNMPTTQH